MDRMGLLVPAYEGTRELTFTTVSPDEYSFDLEVANALGCVVMHSNSGGLLPSETHHMAIYPETGGLTLWRNGLVEVEPTKDEEDTFLSPTQQTFATIRIDGLVYRGIYRREGRLPLLSRYQHRFSRAEAVKSGDRVALSDPEGNKYQSRTIDIVERP